jgi:hypothetical protein
MTFKNYITEDTETETEMNEVSGDELYVDSKGHGHLVRWGSSVDTSKWTFLVKIVCTNYSWNRKNVTVHKD